MPQKTGYHSTPTSPTTHPEPQTAASVAGTEELLDEIDSVLEENVLEVLRTFVNRGGQ